ncbi:MAG TPA: hypothetical protein VKW76_04395 [Candidatus Binatia bacterium]|nr:hypothetical protein [Candidatus Binatia bacterium]
MRSSIVVTVLAALLACGAMADAAPRGRSRPRPPRAAGVTPSCRPGRHTLTYHGGDLVAQPGVFVLFWGAQWQSDPTHLAAAADLRALFQQLGGSAYGCTWREYELPGRPLAAGSYLGDEVIASAPVAPGGELADAVIRQQILTEAAAGRAPVPADDVVYVVAPPQGVPVVDGGETGCGGSNFTFCGYHDSFVGGGSRVRYAVLPFPCTQGGGTCFVDGGSDAGTALEAVGSHELAEIVTDPDAPPVAAGGWYDDRTGEENADVCESEACLATLSAGADTLTLNSLWSNLARGCVASAPCAAPPVACTDPAPGACVANERSPVGCAFEWLVDPDLGLDRNGLPSATVSCADGQPFCDFDATADGQCTFHVAVCLNSADPRLACVAAPVAAVALGGRLASGTDAADQANAAALLGALAGIDGAAHGTVAGSTVTYGPPATTPDACSGYLDVVVPLRPSGTGPRAGTGVLALRVQTLAGAVSERLKLVCLPTFP